MSVSGIEAPFGALGFTPLVPGAAGATTSGAAQGADQAQAFSAAMDAAGTQGVQGVQGPEGPSGVGRLVSNGVESLEAMHDRTDRLAVQAATGDLGAIHQYTLAATEMSVATQLTVAVRNKAVEAFNEIMRMAV